MKSKNKNANGVNRNSSVFSVVQSIVAVAAIAFILYIFTFYVDGEMGVILIAFLLFAPVISFGFMLYSRKHVRISLSCDGYVKKFSKLTVTVTVERTGRLPLGIIEVCPAVSEVFDQKVKTYRLAVARAESKKFSFDVPAVIGGNGWVAIDSVFTSGFLGFLRLRAKCVLPQPVSVGVIPDIPEIKASNQLFRNIADVVLTTDDEEDRDTSMLFSANTAPGYEHREYVSGDPLKRVNWKLSSKKNTLMVRLDEAVASVQPMIVLDLYRRSSDTPVDAVIREEHLIQAVFGLLEVLIRQGIACNFAYTAANGDTVMESVDNPDYPEQLLLKVLAVRIRNDRRIPLSGVVSSACACVIATTDCGGDISALTSHFDSKDNICLLSDKDGTENHTDISMWYLDSDNNFKMV